MFENIENLKIEEIHKGSSKTSISVKERKQTSFVLRTSGCTRYTFPESVVDLKVGEIIFLPKGSSYTAQSIGEEPSEYVALRFTADFGDAMPFVHSLEGFRDFDMLKNDLPLLWKFGGKSERYRCYSVFYGLLAHLEELEKQKYEDKNKLELIEPAISYLKKHIYDSDLNIETLCRLCGISGTYFRKIFQANFAVSPQQYILSKRLTNAKIIIESGDFDSVADVAASVGYSDSLYFSRAFKKKYGVSPSQYAKL